VIIGIDGHSGAGKSTLAAALSRRYDCNVFHMDDFFLQPFQRTPERLSEVGGNVDYERFYEEVIVPLKSGRDFSYRVFDCAKSDFGEEVLVKPRRVSIVEGVYSMRFYEYFDLCVFMEVDEHEQLRRIKSRSPHLYERFVREWIPKENEYFTAFNVKQKCRFVYKL
jgi:uridine kinase